MRNLSVIKGMYQGNGVTRLFAIPFEYSDTAQIFVSLATNLDGDYKIDPVDSSMFKIDTEAQGIVYPKSTTDSPISSGQILIVWRSTDLLQLLDLANQGAAWPDSIEAGLDKLHQIVQELAEELSRCIKMRMIDKSPEEFFAYLNDLVEKAHQTKEYAAQVAAIRDYIQYLYDHLPDYVARHNQDKEAHPYLRKEIEQLHNLFFKDLIEQVNGQLTISADSYDTPVRMILTEDNEITFGENEFLTKNFEYDEDGNVMPVA